MDDTVTLDDDCERITAMGGLTSIRIKSRAHDVNYHAMGSEWSPR
jgi:hypothetical protein